MCNQSTQPEKGLPTRPKSINDIQSGNDADELFVIEPAYDGKMAYVVMLKLE